MKQAAIHTKRKSKTGQKKDFWKSIGATSPKKRLVLSSLFLLLVSTWCCFAILITVQNVDFDRKPTRTPTFTPTTFLPTATLTATLTPKPAPPLHPIGATAICADGTYSYSKTRRGTCSHHGGVSVWLK